MTGDRLGFMTCGNCRHIRLSCVKNKRRTDPGEYCESYDTKKGKFNANIKHQNKDEKFIFEKDSLLLEIFGQIVRNPRIGDKIIRLMKEFLYNE